MKAAAIVLIVAAGVSAFAASRVSAGTAPPLAVGDVAPDFSLPVASRDSVSREPVQLSSLVGQRNVVLAFYPADWSGGCTREVCTLRDNFGALAALNAEILGVSGDYVYSHHEWAKFHHLPFRLASDHDHAVAKQYGSFNEANGYNRRTVFVVDRKGKVAYTDMAYSTRDSVSFVKLRVALQGIQ